MKRIVTNSINDKIITELATSYQIEQISNFEIDSDDQVDIDLIIIDEASCPDIYKLIIDLKQKFGAVIIVLTADVTPSHRLELYWSGINSYIFKPYTDQELLMVIEEMTNLSTCCEHKREFLKQLYTTKVQIEGTWQVLKPKCYDLIVEELTSNNPGISNQQIMAIITESYESLSLGLRNLIKSSN